ncbi:hypothetical protein HHI36_006704 [Cryptolaemus montrouzieri]|uniref:Beta-catenin-interacting ICAT domain-containing protein n=1 Tax=Cryptolaemus montrouzieri TaxID=559131 RepID=A0ABD2NZ89_9CUCU
MDTSGNVETDNLKRNLEIQLDRLVEQLEDLESYKDDMEEEEYNETKKETKEQLQEFNESLEKLMKGNISLVSKLAAVRLTTQLAISNAFKTPEIIRMFAKQEPKLLREKLKQLEDDVQLNKILKENSERQKAEILTALRHLGEQLSREDLQFLEKHNDIANAFKNIQFIEVQED